MQANLRPVIPPEVRAGSIASISPVRSVVRYRRNRTFAALAALWLSTLLSVDQYPDDLPLTLFDPRMVCTSCGAIGCADVRPNWKERPERPSRMRQTYRQTAAQARGLVRALSP